MKSFGATADRLRGRPPYRGLTPTRIPDPPRAYTGSQPVSGAGRNTGGDSPRPRRSQRRVDPVRSGTDRESRDERNGHAAPPRPRRRSCRVHARSNGRGTMDARHRSHASGARPRRARMGPRVAQPDGGGARPAGDEVVGRGCTGTVGRRMRGSRAPRAGPGAWRTIVCTLEPCNHHGATPVHRGPRSTRASHAVKIVRPTNQLVDGSGLARLRAAGLDVRDGVLAAERTGSTPRSSGT